ncbi:hypothetical protein LCGC14_1084830 [marine sediment metagenome]|uniref:Fibronectin type-III domain-containing protein n=1 Tax=marine sediment metagenome TaxID=412755 RepID=A0A0F9MIL5_9ZZZZ
MGSGIYESYTTGDDGGEIVSGIYKRAQTFTPSTSHTIDRVRLKLYRVGSPGTLSVKIYATAAGLPTGAALASGTTNGDTLTTSTSGAVRDIYLGAGTALSSGTQYAIEAEAADGTPSTHEVRWRWDASSPTYSGGGGLRYPTFPAEDPEWEIIDNDPGGIVDFIFIDYGVQEVSLNFPADEATDIDVDANLQINIFNGLIQEWELYIDGNLYTEADVIAWSGLKYINPSPDFGAGTTYQWYVRTKDWTTPFSWSQTATWSFTTAGVAPEKPINPIPTDAAADVTLDQATITWEDGGNADTYNVYYGDTLGNLTLVSSGQVGLSFTIQDITLGSPFDYLITRYWRVDAVNAFGTTTGDEWSFVSIAFDQIRVSYRLISGGNGQGPYDSPPGVQGTDWEYTGESNMITIKKLIAAANNTIWIEDI